MAALQAAQLADLTDERAADQGGRVRRKEEYGFHVPGDHVDVRLAQLVPKIVAVLLALLFLLPWIMQKMTGYTEQLILSLPQYVH